MRYSSHSIVRVIASKPARALTCAALAVAFAGAPVLSPVAAYAVSAETQAEISEAQSQVDQYAAEYKKATEKLEELQAQIDENTARIAEIEAELPEMQERAASAMREQYKYRSGANPLASLVLKSESLSDFITTCVYMEEVQSANNDAIDGLTTAQQELEQKKVELDEAKSQVEEEQKNAEEALKAAQQARSEAQAKAEAEAAAELAALQAKSQEEQSAAGVGSGVSGDNPYNETTSGSTVDTSVSSGGVNWNMSYDEFINEWTTRIDNYLAGSPLAGYGRTFAEAAWNTGTDPRWSPAISCIESTKGRYCANSFNAWGLSAVGGGWMSFGSWTDGINYHVSYPRNYYGPTLTPAAAQKYCPPTWQDWYNKVAGQMSII